MEYFDYDRVKQRFLSVTGMPADDFPEGSIFDNAEQFLLSHLTADPAALTQPQLRLCENAVAAVAVYDCCMTARLARRPVMSENGMVTAQRGTKDITDAARAFRSDAFGQLTAAGLAQPVDFAFMGV